MHSVAQLVFTLGKIGVNGSPNEFAVKDDVAAMLFMHQMRATLKRCFGVHDVGEDLIVNLHQLGGIFCQGAGLGHDGRHPLARVACGLMGQGVASDLRRVHTGQGGVGVVHQLVAREHSVHAWHGQGLTGIDF